MKCFLMGLLCLAGSVCLAQPTAKDYERAYTSTPDFSGAIKDFSQGIQRIDQQRAQQQAYELKKQQYEQQKQAYSDEQARQARAAEERQNAEWESMVYPAVDMSLLFKLCSKTSVYDLQKYIKTEGWEFITEKPTNGLDNAKDVIYGRSKYLSGGEIDYKETFVITHKDKIYNSCSYMVLSSKASGCYDSFSVACHNDKLYSTKKENDSHGSRIYFENDNHIAAYIFSIVDRGENFCTFFIASKR